MQEGGARVRKKQLFLFECQATLKVGNTQLDLLIKVLFTEQVQ
jgi:hypothetical protein